MAPALGQESTLESTIPLPPPDSLDGYLRSKVPNRPDLSIQVETHRASRVVDTTQQEFVLPVRLTAIQRRVYKSLVLEHAAMIEAFCQDPSDQELSFRIRSLIVSLNASTIHPLLLANMPPSPHVPEVEDAWYIVQASSKFELLIDLVESLRQHPLRISVIINDASVRALLVRVFKGLQIRYSRADIGAADESTQDNSLGDVEILLMSNDSEELGPGSVPDLCIAFDNDSSSPYYPLLRLVSTNSAEHISRQVNDQATLISIVTSLSENVGICSYDSGEIVQKVIQYLSGKALKLDELQELIFTSSQFEEISYTVSNGERPSTSRTLLNSEDDMVDIEPALKIIVTEIDGLEVHTEEATTSRDPDPATEVEAVLSHVHANPQAQDILDYTEIMSLPSQEQTQFISPIHLEKMPSQIYNETRSEIWSRSTPDQEKIATLEADIDRMMLRFDDLREECRTLSELKDEAQTQAISYQKRLERLLEENRTARLEKSDMKMELDRLKMPTLPEESSPEYLGIENQRLRTELEKSKKSSLSKMQDFEFVRQQYQQASSAAADLASENETLKEQVRDISSKIEGGLGYKLAVAKSISANESLVAEVENLSLRNDVLIEQLRRMRDEKLVIRGRGEGRRENTQERKRATSASEVGQRKKLDKLGASRLSVASLINPGLDLKQSQAMVRGQSHDPSSFTRGRERQIHATRAKAAS